eukprot:scaffold5301_cov51-Skeletonema_menzelii.AAC.2
MEQSANYAAAKDVQIMSSKEECALGMEQMSNDAAAKGAQIELKKEECALGMEQRSNDAVAKDVQILLRKEECALGMGHTALRTMNLLLLDQNSRRLPLLQIYHIRALLVHLTQDVLVFLARLLSVKKS